MAKLEVVLMGSGVLGSFVLGSELLGSELLGSELLVIACLSLLALAHSVLGEVGILRPLFAAEWSVAEPRWGVERILRFAWHLTSGAWLALACIVGGTEPLGTVAVLSLWSAGVVFVMLRGHLAWPLFLLAGLGAMRADGLLGDNWLQAGAVAAASALVVAAVVHLYWAFGGEWMLDRAVPTGGGAGREAMPGRGLTLLVAGALAVFAALVLAVATSWGPAWLRWLTMVGTAVLVLRAIGDGKVAGFTKTVRDTSFAAADDRWFTPLIVFLAMGAAGALTIS